ncbi:beta-propeller repeat protein [Leptospira weilii serovar Ranarum str. ICFT]|uniref:Beta-propeller repeat protein n=1 Tax=Leptospira weilii serovar Ranarum str. ICFT TaxID=1218598 RepID=N1W9X3_9LEPT|nr:SBBP repeat-containing protein [Leptospira weilii]EMY77011.1 beta-propeller repeat protein [Leptospira weilii serovar Ranarum str. ICFT]
MILSFLFLFILLQTCSPTRISNPSNPETKDYWLQFLFRGVVTEVKTGTEIEGKNETEDEIETVSLRKNLNNLELEWTLLVGAPNARSTDVSFVLDKNGFVYAGGTTNRALYNTNRIGIRDIILGKYDSNKNTIWTKQVGAPGGTLSVAGIAVDPNGNLYVVGNTKGDFAGPHSSEQDMFLIKFNSDGTQVWAKQTGGVGEKFLTYPAGIVVDTFGNSYIAGTSTGPFGGPRIGRNGFIVKFDTDGNQVWVQQIAIAGGQVYSNAVTVDKVTGHIYMTGQVSGNLATDTIPGIGHFDLFILKYDSDGNREFFAQLGRALSWVEGASISVDPLSNVFVGGNSNGNLESSAETGRNFRGTLVKYDSSGVLQWVKQFGPIEKGESRKETVITDIRNDEDGNIFTTGWSTGNIINGNDNSKGISDVFLTIHNSSGEIVRARQIGTSNVSMYGTGIGLDLKGNLYCSGYTNGAIHGVPIRGSQDLFILKYK